MRAGAPEGSAGGATHRDPGRSLALAGPDRPAQKADAAVAITEKARVAALKAKKAQPTAGLLAIWITLSFISSLLPARLVP